MCRRTVEPVKLLFKGIHVVSQGILQGEKGLAVIQAFPIKRLLVQEETFVPRAECIPQEDALQGREIQTDLNMTVVDVRIDKREAYRVYDRFEEEEIEVLPDGNFMVHFHLTMDDWGYGVLFELYPSAEVLAPEAVRQEMKWRVQQNGEMVLVFHQVKKIFI